MSKETQSEPTISPTIYGIETEYSCMVRQNDGEYFEIVGQCHASDGEPIALYREPDERTGTDNVDDTHVANALEELGIIYGTDKGYLSNGGRLYEDASGMEYCTAETTSAEEAVHRMFDGDEIVFRLFRYLQENGVIDGFQLNRRTTDHNRNSRGVHLNHSTILDKLGLIADKDYVFDSLATLNAIKGTIFGAGGLLLNIQGETEFHHAPKQSVTGRVRANMGSYAEHALVRYPFKTDYSGISRVETIGSDALNFAWPMRASLVMTDAVIKMLELGVEEIPNLTYVKESAVEVGHHGFQKKVYVETGEYPAHVYAVEVLSSICELALEQHAKHGFLNAESVQVLQEVIDIVDIVRTDWTKASKCVESIARYIFLRHKMESDGVDIDSEKICRMDYYWDMIGGGVAEKIRKQGNAGWLGFSRKYSPADTKRRIATPPQDTRARLRGEKILNNPDADVDWRSIGYKILVKNTDGSLREDDDAGSDDERSTYPIPMHPTNPHEDFEPPVRVE